jgi:hypothetical protein
MGNDLTCKLCKRDLSEFKAGWRNEADMRKAHTTAHLQDLVRDMHRICAVIAKAESVSMAGIDLAKDILLRSEIIDGGLF